MTIEEIKAYLEKKIAEIDEKFKNNHMYQSEDSKIGEHDAYSDSLRLLNEWNGK